MQWSWTQQIPAPEPEAIVGIGGGARALMQRLAAMNDDELARYKGTAAHEVLVVFANEAILPWAPDIAYAAPCALAPELWLPTTQRPVMPLDLVAKAVLRQHKRLPLLLWPKPQWLLPLDRQVPVNHRWLDHLRQAWR